MNKNQPICENCNSNAGVVKILYGRPSKDGMKQAKEGKVILGGCCPKPENWKCKKCDRLFI